MARRKLQRIAELTTFPNVIQSPGQIKRGWGADYFYNDHPITLELACGKGEYTIELAQRFPQRNFIGADIKGARLWKGAKAALDRNLKNVAFLRTQIEQLGGFFHEQEVDELWITFPDPYPNEAKANKRLTSPRFLNMYRKLLRPGGVIHLKTDDWNLFRYTLGRLNAEQSPIHVAVEDLYSSSPSDGILAIKTAYEIQHLREGKTIRYLRFGLSPGNGGSPSPRHRRQGRAQKVNDG